MSVAPLTVAVTGLNATDNPGPGVALIRALRSDPRFEGRIVGLAYDSLDPGLYCEGLLDAAFLIPYPSAGREALFERLAYIKQRVGLDVLLPTLDSELPAVLDQEPALRRLGVHTFLPTRAQYDQRSKARLYELHTRHGLPVPYAEVLTDPAALYSLRDRLTFPLVVKGVFYGAKIAHTLDEAVLAFHKAAAEWGLPIIVQQFVPGEDYNVCALGDGEGGTIGAVAMKKLLVTESGKGWAGVTIDDPPLLDLTRRIIGALRWRGGCEVEVRRDPRGQYHLLEINPRFPAWVDLTAGAGQNLPLASVRRAIGQPVQALPDYTVGTAFVRISLNQIVPISALEAISTIGEVVPEPTR